MIYQRSEHLAKPSILCSKSSLLHCGLLGNDMAYSKGLENMESSPGLPGLEKKHRLGNETNEGKSGYQFSLFLHSSKFTEGLQYANHCKEYKEI